MFVGSQLSLRAGSRDPAYAPVRVLLWQSRHNTYGIEWLVEPVAGSRRVFLKHSEHREHYQPRRIPGQKWTRTLITITRQLAERHGLRVLTDVEVADVLGQLPPAA